LIKKIKLILINFVTMKLFLAIFLSFFVLQIDAQTPNCTANFTPTAGELECALNCVTLWTSTADGGNSSCNSTAPYNSSDTTTCLDACTSDFNSSDYTCAEYATYETCLTTCSYTACDIGLETCAEGCLTVSAPNCTSSTANYTPTAA